MRKYNTGVNDNIDNISSSTNNNSTTNNTNSNNNDTAAAAAAATTTTTTTNDSNTDNKHDDNDDIGWQVRKHKTGARAATSRTSWPGSALASVHPPVWKPVLFKFFF